MDKDEIVELINEKNIAASSKTDVVTIGHDGRTFTLTIVFKDEEECSNFFHTMKVASAEGKRCAITIDGLVALQ